MQMFYDIDNMSTRRIDFLVSNEIISELIQPQIISHSTPSTFYKVGSSSS